MGRNGYADIGVSGNFLVSKHHILITKRGGQLFIKDVSTNGRTSYSTVSSGNRQQGSKANGADNGNRAGGQHAAGAHNQSKINECKNILGITVDLPADKEAALKIIKKAYRQKVNEWHPDKNPHRQQEADEQIKLINEANEMLLKFYK